MFAVPLKGFESAVDIHTLASQYIIKSLHVRQEVLVVMQESCNVRHLTYLGLNIFYSEEKDWV